MNIIAMLSDFGDEDYYVPAMKAVILSINRDVNIVDITHKVNKWDILDGAFKLLLITPYLPKGAIILAVVDPGVGTDRYPIVIKTNNYVFVGPDNGLMYLAAERDGIQEIRRIENSSYMLRDRTTFDGRDVFAPVAAYISKGAPLGLIGRRLTEIKKIELPKPRISRDEIEAKVLHVDYFGNIILNVSCEDFSNWVESSAFVYIKPGVETVEARVSKSYEELGGSYGVLCGGTGFIEVALYRDSAAEKLGVNKLDNLILIRQ